MGWEPMTVRRLPKEHTMARRLVADGWRRSAGLFLLFTAIAQTTAAQGIAGSFEQLQVLVSPGDTVTVMDATGVETKGTIAALSSSTLTLLAEGTQRELSENEITTIKRLRTDSLANGALYGAAGGVAFATTGLIIFAGEGLDASEAVAVLGAYAAIGTGIGVAVDALIRRQHVIYQRQPASGLQLGIAPWLTRQQKGVLLTLRF
jgi:hypothetical protein